MDFATALINPYYKAYQLALLAYPKATVLIAEKIYKLETANYTSTQFQNGYSAGMVAFSPEYPYGWTTLETNLWDKRIGTRPWGTWSTTVNGAPYSYLKFPTFTVALIALCQRLSELGNDPTKYNGGEDPDYAEKIAAITNDYVV